MVEPLPITWYTESPIDFEHKQYVLFAYLNGVEFSFINKILSPHLLHMEKMLFEMKAFEESIKKYKDGFDKHRYIYIYENPKLIGENDQLLEEVIEIVNFSIPEITSKIKFGYKVLKKNSQVLY